MMTSDLSAQAPPDTQADTYIEDRQAAEVMYRDALDRGETLSGSELARRFGRPDRWGRRVIDRVRADRPSTPTSTNGDNPATGKGDRSPKADRSPARKRTPRSDVPVMFVWVTAVGVAVVAVVCAVVSYVHLRHLATVAGTGTLAAWLPLGIDGLAVSATTSVIVDKHHGRRAEPLAVLGVLLGVAGSLAGNLAAVDPELISVRAVRLALAAYPPLALALAGHLLARMILGGRK